MTFTSFAFFAFLAGVFLVDRIAPGSWRNTLLLAASYFFYGWWDTRFLFLLVLSSATYYATGILIHRGEMTRAERLTASLWVAVSALAFVGVRAGGHAHPWAGGAWGAWVRGLVDGLIDPRRAWALLAVLGAVAASNLAYPRLARLPAGRRRQVAAFAGIGGNLAILGAFKYYNFFIDNVGLLVRALGVDPLRLHLEIALPVGISFYTFQGMTYAVDVYRGRLEPTSRFRDFALFHAFFPLILSGPIERAARLLPQIAGPRQLQLDQVRRGVGLIILGLFKKIVIADGIAASANAVFGATAPVSAADAWVGAIAFALQLYCDFSGYSDAAVGTASFFGIELTTNFRNPYFSSSASEFWSRWHISLSTWFRDYVFYPLGGPRGSTFRWVRNVLVTFLLTGLWHGAAWHYVLWGLYHGVMLCVQRGWESRRPKRAMARSALARVAGVAFYFVLTCYGWVVFRAQSLEQVVSLTRSLWPGPGALHLTAPTPPVSTIYGLPVLLAIELAGFLSGGKPLERAMPQLAWTALYALMLFGIVLGAGLVSTQFVYFVF